MVELRAFIESSLRGRHRRPLPASLTSNRSTSGRSLVLAAQETSGLAPEFQLVHHVGNQYLLSPAAERFVEQVVWENDIASGWKPHRVDYLVIREARRALRPAGRRRVSTATLFVKNAEAGASAERSE